MVENIILNGELLKNKIYVIRGQKVMLDYDLAEIYGYTTKAFNQQIARNSDKFDGEDFMFRLTKEEYFLRSHFVTSNYGGGINLRSQNVTASCESGTNLESQNVISSYRGEASLRSQNVISSWGGARSMPYAFTEQGIYMLMTVLHGKLATEQSKILIRTFKKMKDYILENQERLEYRNNLSLALKVTENSKDIEKMKNELEKLDVEMRDVNEKLSGVVMKSEISPIIFDFGKMTEQREYVFLNGEPFKASEAYTSIYNMAKKAIYVVDNYISVKTLRHLRTVKSGVEIIIFSDNLGKYLHKIDYEDFAREFPKTKIEFVKTNKKVHDRFIIIDCGEKNEKVFHCGASEKDAGGKMTVISMISSEQVKNVVSNEVKKMLKNEILKLV